MKRIIRFSKLFIPTAVISAVLIIAGIVSYVIKGGFNLGVDFQAGLIQEVQFAPSAFGVTYSGAGNASISFDRNNLYIIFPSGVGIEGRTVTFPFAEYRTVDSLITALGNVDGIGVSLSGRGDINSSWLVQSAQGNPQLGSVPFVVHYLAPNSDEIPIRDVRDALASLGRTVSVQQMGANADRHFMIRLEEDSETEGGGVPAEKIISVLESVFGSDGVVVIRSDFVGSRFSRNLSQQAAILLVFTLLLILIYASIRFKPQYAIGAVLAILHDALIIVAFVTWTNMEFNTTTIAAILTILGYSINDTIVIFDRIRETIRIYPDDKFVNILDRALTETLGRTIITTLTTMLAVLSLYIFTTGSMKDFALALLVGMVSGVYSTIWIASGFVNWWESRKIKKAQKKLTHGTVPAKA